MINQMVTIKIDEDTVLKMEKQYANFQKENNGDYIYFFASLEGANLTIYQSKNGFKAYFSGPYALEYAKQWDRNAVEKTPKVKEKEEFICFDNQIGSDEVGVGDLCLPMIVVAAFVSKDDIDELIALGVHDSKKLSDEDILNLGPTLISKFKVSKLTLPNEKYNEMISKGNNINTLKAKMHNQALLNVS